MPDLDDFVVETVGTRAEAAQEPIADTPPEPVAPVEAVGAEPEASVEEGVAPVVSEKVSKRIARLTWEREEARRQHAEVVAENARLKQSAAPVPQMPVAPVVSADDPEPTIDQFADREDPYLALVQAHAARTARQEWRMADAARRELDAHQQLQSRIQTFRATTPDYDQLVNSSTAPLSEAMRAALIVSPQAPEIAYHLAQHPEVAASLAEESRYVGLAGVPMVRRLLEALVSRSPASSAQGSGRVSTASAPIQPVGSSPVSTPPDLEELPFDEFVRQANARDRKRRAGGWR